MSRPPVSSHPNRGTSGFTLVEVLVALAILSTALVPVFSLASSAVSLSTRIKNDLIASNLAQEGVEVVRAVRDANWFNGRPFDDGLTAAGCETGCAVEYDSSADDPDTGFPAQANADDFLRMDTATGLYQYRTGDPTLFRRTVTIRAGATPSELVVTSRVDWRERGIDRHVTVEYHLFDWL